MKKNATFWIGKFRYQGELVEDTNDHWIVLDNIFKKRVWVPKHLAIMIED